MSQMDRQDRRRGPELRPFDRRLVLLSLIAILVSGSIGWALGTAATRLIGLAGIVAADHSGHRPIRPPLPTSPFQPR